MTHTSTVQHIVNAARLTFIVLGSMMSLLLIRLAMYLWWRDRKTKDWRQVWYIASLACLMIVAIADTHDNLGKPLTWVLIVKLVALVFAAMGARYTFGVTKPRRI